MTLGALTKREAAAYVRCSERYLDKCVATGTVRKTKLGSKTVFRVAELDRFLASCEIEPNVGPQVPSGEELSVELERHAIPPVGVVLKLLWLRAYRGCAFIFRELSPTKLPNNQQSFWGFVRKQSRPAELFIAVQLSRKLLSNSRAF
jgi:excisionase family DNA binding protein